MIENDVDNVRRIEVSGVKQLSGIGRQQEAANKRSIADRPVSTHHVPHHSDLD
jgi:hypothetical protein